MSRETCLLMDESLRHRGPDGSEVFTEGEVSLGLARLAILDPSASCLFHSNNGRFVSGCNGEIYNWRELRAELEKKGHRFRTACDSEVIPAGWQEWGEELFAKLNGMFALWIYDRDEKSLVLARDRCGQKPLYYSEADQLVFASEIRALVEAGVELSPDSSTLQSYLALRYIPEPETFYQGVKILPAGHFMKCVAGAECQISAYWKPFFHFDEAPLSLTDAVDELSSLTGLAVRRSLQSDVPMMVYLSAGVDSSLLTKMIVEEGVEVRSQALGFGSKSDETGEAADFAAELGLDHQSVMCGCDILNDLPRVVSQMERPVGDLLTLAFDRLASHSSARGCKVALGGEGADELFGGYSFLSVHQKLCGMNGMARRGLSAGLRYAPLRLLNQVSAFPASLGQSGRARVVNYVSRFSKVSKFERAFGLRFLFSKVELMELLQDELLLEWPEIEEVGGGLGELDDHLASQFGSWLQDWSLIRQDKNAMAHSVEYRSPFLDTDLIDFSFRVPTQWKLKSRSDKWLWRKMAEKHLGQGVSKRSKQPFYLPLEDPVWKQELWNMFDEVLSERQLEETGWFKEGAIESLVKRAKQNHEFLLLKQVAALVILSLHLKL